MKKIFEGWISHFRIDDSIENDIGKFSNDLVVQVDSDDNKTIKKNNDYKILFFVSIKTKFISFSKIICQCFYLKRKKSDDIEIARGKQKDTFSSPEKSSTRGILKEQPTDLKGKKTLILDLDETLVHSYFNPTKCDLYLEVPYQGKNLEFFINIRPGAEEFLETMSQHYEVIIYTASMKEYAEKVIDYLDKKKIVSHRLYRESCTFYQRGYVKDLSKMNRNLKDTIIIDNSSFSFAFQPDNGFLIKSFFEDQNDRELYNLTPFLIFASKIYDVRPIKQWNQKFQSNVPFFYFNMENNLENYEIKNKPTFLQIEKNGFIKKKKIQNEQKQKKQKNFPLKISYCGSESAQKLKKKDESDEENTAPNNSNLDDIEVKEKSNDDFQEKSINDENFDIQRFYLDSSNINSPIMKKEIHLYVSDQNSTF